MAAIKPEHEIIFRAAEIGRPEGVFIGSYDGGDGAPRRALASRRALLGLSNSLLHFPELADCRSACNTPTALTSAKGETNGQG